MLIRLLNEFRKCKEVKFLTEAELEEIEDKTLGKLINTGRTGKHVNVDNFLKELKNK